MFFLHISRWLLGLFSTCLALLLIACTSVPSSQTQATSTPTAHVPTRSTARLTYLGHRRAVNSVMWSPDGLRLASGSDDGTVQVWSATTGRHLWTYNYGSIVFAVIWSPDGKHIAAGGDGSTIVVLDARTGHLLTTYGQLSSNSIVGLAWSPDGKKVALGSSDGTVVALDVTTGKLLTNYTGHTDAVNRVAWSPDGKRLAAASHDGTVRVWEAATGHTLLTYREHMAPVWEVVWSPNGKDIASSTGASGVDPAVRANNSVKVWDATTGQTLLTSIQQGDRNQVYALAWSPDGKHIASGSDDTVVRIWNVATGHTDLIYRGHTNIILQVAWSPDGKEIASASQDGIVQVWLPEL